MDQRKAPVYEALQEFRRNRVVPFDVPGHKRGRGNPELVALLGKQCVGGRYHIGRTDYGADRMQER